MVVFDRLWETMSRRNISTYPLREKYGIDSKTVRKLRGNQTVTTATLGRLCAILDCRLEDIAEYIPDQKESDQEVFQ